MLAGKRQGGRFKKGETERSSRGKILKRGKRKGGVLRDVKESGMEVKGIKEVEDRK